MFKKLVKITILLTIGISTLFASTDLFMKKKIEIENNFRGKWNPDLYKIWIGTRDDANINSKYQIKKKSPQKGKQYIPGLPTIPSAPKTVSTPSSSYNESYIVYIYLDSSYDTPAIKNTMSTIIKADIWPSLNHCADCVQFEAMDFYHRGNKKVGENFSSDTSLSAAEEAAKALEAKLIELQDANIALERTNELNRYQIEEQEKAILEQEFADLEEQLKELQSQTSIKENEVQEMKNFRMSYLEEQYKMQMMFKDSLLSRYGQKLDNIYDRREGCMDQNALNYNSDANAACESCCRYSESSTKYISGCMDPEALNHDEAATQPCKDCCDYKGCMDPEALNYNSLATKEGFCEYEESNTMMVVLIILVSILIILSVFAIVSNKKKVVYLKPKDESKNENGISKEEASGQPKVAPEPVMPQTTSAVDEGVLQSEIQSQRQSAVAMSAGQKEGATQILKDWLDESKNENENLEE